MQKRKHCNSGLCAITVCCFGLCAFIHLFIHSFLLYLHSVNQQNVTWDIELVRNYK